MLDLDIYHRNCLGRYNSGRFESAIECLDKVIDEDHLHPDAWYLKGVALRKLHRHEEALSSFDVVLELTPENANAWRNKAIALNELGRHEDA